MSGWPRVIEGMFGADISIAVHSFGVSVSLIEDTVDLEIALSVDQCAAVIAAITDAAKVVTGDKS